MKKTWLGLVLIAASVLGCSPEPLSESPAAAVLSGEHQLRKLVERIDTHSRISGYFLLFIGSMRADSSSVSVIKFAWQMKDGTYALSSLPLDKIRVKLDNNKVMPTIKFRWTRQNNAQIDYLMANAVVYALITVKESDWPVKIQMPLEN